MTSFCMLINKTPQVSVKLNQRGQVFTDILTVEPQQEEFQQFLNFLETENKTKPKIKTPVITTKVI